jgi:FixJ family two-component response regulator
VSAASTVYLIDDDVSVRRGLGRLLQAAGYNVVACDTPEAFLALPSLITPACVLLDVRMPKMTGLELQTALHDEGRTTPIVMMSGHVDASTRERALSAGAVAVLSKPVELNTLVRALERGLARDRVQGTA